MEAVDAVMPERNSKMEDEEYLENMDLVIDY